LRQGCAIAGLSRDDEVIAEVVYDRDVAAPGPETEDFLVQPRERVATDQPIVVALFVDQSGHRVTLSGEVVDDEQFIVGWTQAP